MPSADHIVELAPSSDAESRLGNSLVSILRHSVSALVAGFNWKTATISAMLRALLFFVVNLRAGHSLALRASLVEAGYAVCASGLAGTLTQRIRRTQPLWLTGLLIWTMLPAMLLTVQYVVHRSFGTPHLGSSMVGSFCFAALGTGFNWFAMRRGAMMVGDSRRSFAADLRLLPSLAWSFLVAFPKRCVDVDCATAACFRLRSGEVDGHFI